jgi:hypothetical protein
MSLKRGQNVTSNTNLLPDIPFKKRKDSRLHPALSRDDDNNDHDEKHKKNKRAENSMNRFGELVSRAHSLSTGCHGTFSTLDDDDGDDDDDDDDNTVYINPYLNLVRSNVIPQEGEGSYNLISPFVPKGSNHKSVTDVNVAGHNVEAQNDLSSSLNYFNLPDYELCGLTSFFDKYPNVFGRTKDESGNECYKISQDTSNGERSDNFVSLLTPKANNESRASVSSEDGAAQAGLSSAPHKLLLKGDIIGKTVDHENSGISGDMTSSMHIQHDPLPSSSSKSCEGMFPLKYGLHSENGLKSLPPVGALGNGHLPDTLFPFKSHLAYALKIHGIELPASSEFDTKMKPLRSEAGDSSSSSTLHEHYRHPNSEFGTRWKLSGNQADAVPLSLKICKSEPVMMSECVARTSSSLSPKLPESEPYSMYKYDVDPKMAEKKSGSSSTVKYTERGISPVFHWNNYRENETLHLPVSENSESSEISRNVERSGGADSSCRNEVKSIASDPANMLTKKLWKFKRELPRVIESTPSSEIGTAREVSTKSMQGPLWVYKGLQRNSDKKVGENVPVVGHQYRGRETAIKEENCAIGNTESPSRANGCTLKDSGIMPLKSKGVRNVADYHCVVIQDVNTDGRKCSEEGAAVFIGDTGSLNGEQNKCGSSDREETILVVSDDSDDDTIPVYDVIDGCEESDDDDDDGDNDDIEIVKCLSKSSVGKIDLSAQRKALDFTKSQARYKNRELKYKSMLAHPFAVGSLLNFSKSVEKPNPSSSANGASNFRDKLRGDKQLFWQKSLPEACGTSDSSMNASRCQPARLCLDLRHPAPAHVPQVLQCGAYDLSRSTMISGTAISPSQSPVRGFGELTRKKMFSQFGGSNFPYTGVALDLLSPLQRPSSLNLPFRMRSESTSSPWAKKHSCDTNLVPTRSECETSTWNSLVSNSASADLAASSPTSVLNIVPNSLEISLEMSVEPGDQEERSVPLTGTSQLMPVLDTSLEMPGASYNVLEGKEIVKKQQNTVEGKTERAQRSSRLEWECAICLETVSSKRGISATMCGHVYCTPCIVEVVYKKKECPTCRRTLDITQVHPLFISG